MKILFAIAVLFITVQSWAGGDNHSQPIPAAEPGTCFSNDGSTHPCSAASNPPRPKVNSPCIDLLREAELTCSRTSQFAKPFIGSAVSSVTLRPSQWAQNPDSKVECKLDGRQGYTVSYNIEEADKVRLKLSSSGNPADSQFFAGLTTENRVAFQNYAFTGLNRFVKRGTELVAISDSNNSNSENGMIEGTVISFLPGNQLVLNGSAVSVGLQATGEFQNLTFTCQ